jgi:tRNA(fMet)-specific endonuclease VapC
VPWDDAVSARFGEIKAIVERQGRRVDDFDLAIAAHATGGAVLVTHDTRHFARVPGLTVEDWS